MKTFRVIWRRNVPISYFSTVNEGQVEKIGLQSNEKVVKIPVVKGSHVRGRFRRWLAKKIILENINQIEKEKDFKERIAILTALYFSGSLVKGYKITEKNILKLKKELEEKDRFGKFFGYMIKDMDNERASFVTGHLYPALKGVNVEGNEDIKNVDPEILTEIKINAGDKWFEITYPLTIVLGGRKAGIVDDIRKIISEKQLPDDFLNEVEELISLQSKKEKSDTKNILNYEVINSGFDLIQLLDFESSSEEYEIEGILTAYLKFFNEVEPFLGGNVTRGFGRVEKVEIKGFQPSEEAFKKYVSSVDLKTITDMIKLSKES